MGSSVYLRKFQMTLDVSNGVPYVMFSRIRESFRNSDIIIEDSVENEILSNRTSANSEYQIMLRGQSFENERGCNEIVQQFIIGLDSFVENFRLSCDIEESPEEQNIENWFNFKTIYFVI